MGSDPAAGGEGAAEVARNQAGADADPRPCQAAIVHLGEVDDQPLARRQVAEAMAAAADREGGRRSATKASARRTSSRVAAAEQGPRRRERQPGGEMLAGQHHARIAGEDQLARHAARQGRPVDRVEGRGRGHALRLTCSR